jgi:nucleoside-diphosphate-sugar epimerase
MPQTEKAFPVLLVTGAAGRVGRALRAVWGENLAGSMPILWQSRSLEGAAGLCWDIGQNPPPSLPTGLIVLHLAGKTSGTPEVLAQNATATEAVCAATLVARGAHVFVMSSAAVYAPGPLPLSEDVAPAPVSPYGVAKLAAERVAAAVLAGSGTGLTILRLANLAGADALLGNAAPGKMVTLDPIAGQAGGPERSYIGPRVLAQVLATLILRMAAGGVLPDVINLAQQPPVSMAALLQARGQDWVFGLPRSDAVARVVLDTGRLAGLTDLPQTSPAALIADMASLQGWPR